MRKIILIIPILLCFFAALAQPSTQVEMADVLRSNGKIYTVVAVILTILIGLFIYLINIDRKITKLEKNDSSV